MNRLKLQCGKEGCVWHVNFVSVSAKKWRPEPSTNGNVTYIHTRYTFITCIYFLETIVTHFRQLEKVNRAYLEWLVAINQTFVRLSKNPFTF